MGWRKHAAFVTELCSESIPFLSRFFVEPGWLVRSPSQKGRAGIYKRASSRISRERF
jgi:hypothetical protein